MLCGELVDQVAVRGEGATLRTLDDPAETPVSVTAIDDPEVLDIFEEILLGD